MSETLFIYGSLHPGRAPAEIADLVQTFQPLDPATVRGHLHGLGPYPGVVLDPNAPTVSGNVFTFASDPQLMARLDAYEECDPSNPQASLFLRCRAQALLPDGSLVDAGFTSGTLRVAARPRPTPPESDPPARPAAPQSRYPRPAPPSADLDY